MIDRKFTIPQSHVNKFNNAIAMNKINRDIGNIRIAIRTQNIVRAVDQVDKVVPLPRASLVFFK